MIVRLALLFLLILPLAVFGDAGLTGEECQTPATGGGTCTSYDDIDAAPYGDSSDSGNVANGNAWYGTKVQLTDGDVVTRIVAICLDNNSDTGSVIASIYTDSSGDPGSEVSGTSVTVAATAIGGTYADVNFDLSSPVEIASTADYWVVFRAIDSAQIGIAVDNTNLDEERARSQDAGSTWPNNYTDQSLRLKVQGCAI